MRCPSSLKSTSCCCGCPSGPSGTRRTDFSANARFGGLRLFLFTLAGGLAIALGIPVVNELAGGPAGGRLA